MTVLFISTRKTGTQALTASKGIITLTGPVKDKRFHIFRDLKIDELPDMTYKTPGFLLNPLCFPSPKSC